MAGVVGCQLVSKREGSRDKARGEDRSRCSGPCEGFWTSSHKTLKPMVMSQFGLIQKHTLRQGLGTKSLFGSNRESLVKTEDKVTRKPIRGSLVSAMGN